jgi:peptide/nickel transport system substrate-binding protein
MNIKRRRPRLLAAAAAAISVLAVAACGSASGGSTSSDTLTLLAGPAGPYVGGLNPFSVSDNPAGQGVTNLVYEPLLMYNVINPTAAPKPWLASAYKWTKNGQVLTFTIKSGKTWTDGKPLTAADVAFTFNLLHKYPALNTQGIEFKSASAPNATTAVLHFAAPAFTQLFSISKVLIVPQHIWSSISNPSTYSNTKPIGSGPYTLTSLTSQAMNFTANPNYWQAGLPKVKNVRVPSYTSQQSAQAAISAGQIDWNTVFLPDPEQQFISKDPAHNKLWLVPAGDWFLCPNTTKAPFNNADVRKALGYSIDRQSVIHKVSGDYYGPSTNVTGLRAGQEKFMPKGMANDNYTYDKSKVASLLTAAGMTKGSNGMFQQSDGSPFKVTLLLPSEYTDWMSMASIYVNEMKAAGIDASLQGVSVNAWTSNVATGNYQVSFCGLWSTDGPYTTYNTLLNSALSAPNGKAATSNVVRWNSSATDQQLSTYRSTGDNKVQVSSLQGVAKTVADDAPIIPLMWISSFGSYTTKRFTGFPGPNNPYQIDAPTNPSTEDVVLHLKPVS